MATKLYQWLYYLVENFLTTKTTTDFSARVKSRKIHTIDDIAEHCVNGKRNTALTANAILR